eukprot:214562-Chlamydomonas_euryale.AAC.8
MASAAASSSMPPCRLIVSHAMSTGDWPTRVHTRKAGEAPPSRRWYPWLYTSKKPACAEETVGRLGLSQSGML